MRLSLKPKDRSFYLMFADSAASLVAGTEVLRELVTPRANRAQLAQRMIELEHECDATTHRIMRQLNSTFVTPFDREDIYELASRLDDVMDYMEAAADLVNLYELAELPRDIVAQVDVLERCAVLTADAMPNLRTLKNLDHYWIEVNRLENEADRVHRRLVARLFGGRYDALEVLKLKDVVDQFEAAADAFEKVANIVETIAVKES